MPNDVVVPHSRAVSRTVPVADLICRRSGAITEVPEARS